MTLFNRIIVGTLASLALCQPAFAATRDLMADTWVATDALGRTLPGARECGLPRTNKTVGIFYFLWLENKPGGLYDISKLLAANPDNPQYGPLHAFHHWGEPHLGYYVSDDEFVIRKHMQMLADAGVDVVVFDVTNALIYEKNYLAVCRVLEKMRAEGRVVPRISFIAYSSYAPTVQKLYTKLYAPKLHEDTWFSWKGKPLLLCPPEGLSPEVAGFFTVRHSWAWTKGHKWFGDGRDRWPWVDNYPQSFGWHDAPDKPEQISVCVAQHPTSNIGRSFHDGKEPPPAQRDPARGICFAEQWKRALSVSPEFVFVTGWNEWVAQRFTNQGGINFLGKKLNVGETFFVDQYNQEFSRDIEPMRGGHGDNYYYQMVEGIRRYKGVRARPKASAPKTIAISSDFAAWSDVRPEFLDDIGDTAHRDHPGWGTRQKQPYINTSGRNDIEAAKVARDQDNLYFYVRTAAPLTTPTGATNWMLLLLDTDGNARNGWAGYDFVVNRTIKNNGTTTLEKNVGGWKWETVCEVKMAWRGNELQLAIPREALKLSVSRTAQLMGTDPTPLKVDFKWADNIPGSGDPMDLIDQGDVAPNGRFNYRFEE
jgi:hypothetical protein